VLTLPALKRGRWEELSDDGVKSAEIKRAGKVGSDKACAKSEVAQ
jgi:hypothetical protein